MDKEANTPLLPSDEVLLYIKENFVLNNKTGEIFSWGRRMIVGTTSNGCKIHDGYSRIRTCGKTLKYHHVVFFLSRGRWPELQVDHINGNKYDNRPENLEEVTNAENQKRRNAKLRASKGAA